MGTYASGEAFIDIVNAHGVEKIFFNPGGEIIELQSLIAQARVEGKKAPKLILCPDESVTISAAHAQYQISGQPQVVLVHSELGTLQMAGNLQNILWGRAPIVIMVAYQTDALRTNWDGKPYDQGDIVRGFVKWDRKLNGKEDLHQVMTEAFQKACTEPAGPVYVYFPMEYLYQRIEKPATPPTPAKIEPLPPYDIAVLDAAADLLLEAKNPLIVTGYAGRYPENVEALVRLAETLCAPVFTGYSWFNFPIDHPLCAGIEQIGGTSRPKSILAEADVILVIDYDIPYVPGDKPPSLGAIIIHFDVDKLTNGRLLWERVSDLFMKADSREVIPALEKLLKDKTTPAKSKELKERHQRIAAKNTETRQTWHETALSQAQQKPISPDWLCYCVNHAIDENTIIVNHTLSHCASVTEQVVVTKPGSWLGCPSGAIGWAMGASLGAKAAALNKTVVTLLTDGGFIWGCPTSTLWTAVTYKLPFLVIICNNQGYGVVRGSQKSIVGEEGLTEEYIREAGVEFMPNYALIAQACGAYGRTVVDPDEVMPAITEALARVRAGQAAVLDIHLGRGENEGD